MAGSRRFTVAGKRSGRQALLALGSTRRAQNDACPPGVFMHFWCTGEWDCALVHALRLPVCDDVKRPWGCTTDQARVCLPPVPPHSVPDDPVGCVSPPGMSVHILLRCRPCAERDTHHVELDGVGGSQPEVDLRRCASAGRGSVYDSVAGESPTSYCVHGCPASNQQLQGMTLVCGLAVGEPDFKRSHSVCSSAVFQGGK